MRTEVIEADTIDVAVEGIFNELNKSKQNVIYFDGWDGLGASAVLQAVAQRLKEQSGPPGLEFELVIHMDCSKWESTRAVQREIAEQLKLPTRVMEMFDKQDEEDDFDGIIDLGSRMEIAEVTTEIQRSIEGRRFVLVLHNGSNEEVDIAGLGLSVYGYLKSKMIWTFQGRFRMDPIMKDKAMKKNTTDAIFSASSRPERDPQELWSYLLREEAAQVACKLGIDPAIVVEYFLYILTLRCTSCHHVHNDYDLATHACNYVICDGIIPEETDLSGVWQVGEALHGEIRLDMDYHNELPSHLLSYAESIPHWSSPAYGFVLVPHGVVPSGMFQHFDKLGVIKLSRCRFNFSSPPFLCCCNLRFLWLDHCQDLRSTAAAQREEEDTSRSWACFQSLWVLYLRYTDCDQILSVRVMDLMTQLRELNVVGAKNWDMRHLQGRLHNIRKLRVTKSTCWYYKNMLSEMESLEVFEFSGNTKGGELYGPASSNSLKTVIIDRCDGIYTICLRGCKELKNLFMKGWSRGLRVLDLSGTSVKTLDLRESWPPDDIRLLGCEKLRAILWSNDVEDRRDVIYMLCIDTTTRSASTDRGEALHVHPLADRSLEQQKEKFKGGWEISLTDAKLLRSLSPVKEYLRLASLHIDIFLTASNIQGTSIDKLAQVQLHTGTMVDFMYKDLLKDDPIAAMMSHEDCPKIFLRPANQEVKESWKRNLTCIIKVMHGQGNTLLKDGQSASTSALVLPGFICAYATSLHVYDNLAITCIPQPPEGWGWSNLKWCRLERCPKLNMVFSGNGSFDSLETFWASHLLTTCYIWEMPCYSPMLIFVHLDHCPRLIRVVRFLQTTVTLYALVTLEIVYCGDLKEVFPLNPRLQEQDKVINFPKLRRIHLHELPSLQRICGCRMSAPKLETIKIRGCWSLKRLPAVGDDTKPPKVDCEKEWWDNLEWDGLEENHHPSLYEPSHSLYYKAQMPRVSVLR